MMGLPCPFLSVMIDSMSLFHHSSDYTDTWGTVWEDTWTNTSLITQTTYTLKNLRHQETYYIAVYPVSTKTNYTYPISEGIYVRTINDGKAV